MQMLATGAVGSLDRGAAHHRAIVPGRTVRAAAPPIAGTRSTARFQDYVEMTCV